MRFLGVRVPMLIIVGSPGDVGARYLLRHLCCHKRLVKISFIYVTLPFGLHIRYDTILLLGSS